MAGVFGTNGCTGEEQNETVFTHVFPSSKSNIYQNRLFVYYLINFFKTYTRSLELITIGIHKVKKFNLLYRNISIESQILSPEQLRNSTVEPFDIRLTKWILIENCFRTCCFIALCVPNVREPIWDHRTAHFNCLRIKWPVPLG